MNHLCEIELEISFFSKRIRTLQAFRKRLANACRNTKRFLEEKITRRKRCAMEAKDRVFYRLNDDRSKHNDLEQEFLKDPANAYLFPVLQEPTARPS